MNPTCHIGARRNASMTKQSRMKIVLALGAVYLIWGSTYYAIKILVTDAPPFFISGSRFIIAGLILFAWEIFRGTPMPNSRQWLNGSITGVSMILFGFGSVVWTSQFAPSAIIAIMVSAVPIWMTVISVLNPSYACPQFRVYVGLIIGLIGVTIMVNPFDLGDHNSIKLEHAAMLLLGTLAWSLGSLYSARVSKQPNSAQTTKRQSMFMSIALQMIIGGFALSGIGVLSGELHVLRFETVTLEAWIALFYLIIFGTLVAFSAYIWLLNNVAPSLAGTYAFVNPLVALLIGAFLAGEALSMRDLIATAVILIGVVLITLGQDREKVASREFIAKIENKQTFGKSAKAR